MNNDPINNKVEYYYNKVAEGDTLLLIVNLEIVN